MKRFDRTFAKVSETIGLYICGVLLLAMMFYVAGNVFFRYCIPRSGGLWGMSEQVGATLVPVVFLGLAYGWYKGAYVVVGILQDRLKGWVLWWFQFAFLLLTLVIFVSPLWYGCTMQTVRAYVEKWLIGGFYSIEWPWRASMAIGLTMMGIRNILDLITMVRTGKVIPQER